MGFSPGFAYLDGLPEPLRAVPRRDRPRPVVPAGSVALANGHAAVYPTASPGGWQLVGRTGFPLLSLVAASLRPPGTGRPGPLHRGRARMTRSSPRRHPCTAGPRRRGPGRCSRSWRRGCAPSSRTVAAGVWPRSGCRAPVPPIPCPSPWPTGSSGNAAGSGALELTGGGTRLRALAACHVAVVGAAPGLHVDGSTVPAGQVVPLAAGQELAVGPLRRGCRTYLSVAGGILGPEVFGSSASDELSGIGAGPLGPGARLHAGPWDAPARRPPHGGVGHRARRGRRARGAPRRARPASRAIRARCAGAPGRRGVPRRG